MGRPVGAIIIAAIISSAVSGCAFGTRRVNLVYGPVVETGMAAPQNLGRVAVAKLGDARPVGEGGRFLGKVRNGYGIPTATVESNQDPVVWVSDGIARSLASQGFVVEKVESPADAGELPTVTGRVTKASGGMYMKMSADVGADLAVERSGQRLFSTQCTGSASQLAWTASAGEYNRLFANALDDFATKCVPLLIPALKTHAAR